MRFGGGGLAWVGYVKGKLLDGTRINNEVDRER
jgi:hypothetical protein